MTDVDRMTDQELRLRAELQRTIVPPPAPASLHAAVDAMAVAHLAGTAPAGRSWRQALGLGARGLRLTAGVVAVVAIAVVGALLLQARGNDDRVAATPPPTLPAMTQSALPDPSGVPTTVDAGAWIDAQTAWGTVGEARELWMTTDGGQAWAWVGRVPEGLEPAFVDRAHAYAATAVADGGTGFRLRAWTTADGGRTWTAHEVGTVPVDGGSRPQVLAHFSDADTGVLLGSSVVDDPATNVWARPVACAGWTTDDGGTTWVPMDHSPCATPQAWWASPLVGLLTDATSTTQLTEDGGRTWRTVTVPAMQATEELYALGFLRATDGSPRLVAVIADRPFQATVYEPDAEGTGWRMASTIEGEPAPDVRAFADLGGGHWLAIGEGNSIPGNVAIWDSWDEGQTWSRSADTLLVADPRTSWADRLHGVLHGGWMDCRDRTVDCGMSTPSLWLTNDGGQTWHQPPF